MKKIILLLSSLLTVLLLVACQTQSKPEETSAPRVQVTLTVKTEKGLSSNKESYNEGTKVLEVLKSHHKVELESGMVTSIDGISQDSGKNTYWMYDINGEMAPKGVEEMTVKDGDTVEFYLQTFE